MSATATSGGASGTGDAEDEIFTTFGGTLPSSSSGADGESAGSVAIDFGRSYGLGAVALGVFAGFALIL